MVVKTMSSFFHPRIEGLKKKKKKVYHIQPPEYAGPEDLSRLQLSSPTVVGNK